MRLLSLVLLLGLFTVMACTSTKTENPGDPLKDVGCTLEKTVVNGLGEAVATTLNCTNKDQIKLDILSKLDVAKFCPQPQAGAVSTKSVVGQIVCPIAVQSVMALAAQKVPVAWGCTPEASTGLVADALTKTCVGLVGGL